MSRVYTARGVIPPPMSGYSAACAYSMAFVRGRGIVKPHIHGERPKAHGANASGIFKRYRTTWHRRDTTIRGINTRRERTKRADGRNPARLFCILVPAWAYAYPRRVGAVGGRLWLIGVLSLKKRTVPLVAWSAACRPFSLSFPSNSPPLILSPTLYYPLLILYPSY